MRYDNQKILRDENGTRYLNRIEYPVIPVEILIYLFKVNTEKDLTI